jgi:hypothetical protein
MDIKGVSLAAPESVGATNFRIAAREGNVIALSG